MNIYIDITEYVGAVDYDNAGGIISYINIPPTENIQEKFQVEIFNFVLNLLDEPITSSIESQDLNFLENMDEDGFLIIKKATVTFEKIKGHEKLVRVLDQGEDYLLHEIYSLLFSKNGTFRISLIANQAWRISNIHRHRQNLERP